MKLSYFFEKMNKIDNPLARLTKKKVYTQKASRGWMDEGKKKKKDPTICCVKETHLGFKDTHRLKVTLRTGDRGRAGRGVKMVNGNLGALGS